MKKKIFKVLSTAGLLAIIAACNNEEEAEVIEEDTTNENVEEESEDMEEGMDHGDMDHEDMDHGDMDHGDMDHNMEGGSEEEIREKAATPPESLNENATQGLIDNQTKNITRIDNNDTIEFAVQVSQTVWPAVYEENQPGTVILVPEDNWQVSLASLNLVHHPNDGPALFIESDNIPEVVSQEISRLQPKGNEEGVEVIVMGSVSDSVIEELDEYNVEQIQEDDPASFAYEIDEAYASIIGEAPENVIVGSMENESRELTTVAGNWIAHMDESLLYVDSDEIPEATSEALEKREGNANIYLLGSESAISANVEEELNEYGEVERIEGESPAELSVAFAQFRDDDNDFGWGINEPGHGLSFISTDTPDLAIAGAPFAHLGKHAPMIWLEEGELTDEVYEYFSALKPIFENNPMEGPYNHGFILGTFDDISFETQGIIDQKLELEGLNGHGGH
ncbi:cell wall-binding repeat-containing protein [Thalassorhabdus alkalitolerans]|uniref:Cell wall-binding repeat-containing protein n=1 Tax=Thalassorhabdus alkalitolerans TaxID=2282697 RepID=A0ABW0YMB3_9BACI